MEQDMTKISVRISQEEKEMLMKYGADNDLSLSQIVRRAIKDFLNRNENSK